MPINDSKSFGLMPSGRARVITFNWYVCYANEFGYGFLLEETADEWITMDIVNKWREKAESYTHEACHILHWSMLKPTISDLPHDPKDQ